MKNELLNHLCALSALLDEALSELELIQDRLLASRKAIEMVQDYINRLKSFEIDTLSDQPELQIAFYKTVSPAVYAHLFYYVRLYKLEASLPRSLNVRRKILKKEREWITSYFNIHNSEFQYYNTCDQSLDHEFFIPSEQLPIAILDEATMLVDMQSCTPMGLIFARFIAYNKLEGYLSNCLETKHQQVTCTPHELRWTDKKIHLQELIYALAYSRSINYGDINVRNLAQLFGNIFKIDLSYIYRAKQDMYTRKNTSNYLDLLKKKFLKGLDDADDLNNFSTI